ncbi:MAG: nucleotidyltransferase family protein [Candidatus Omnitrophica bacterium]|nr:nucleotidyltransferase family protein [Candidatus Omnitrophota bacterium]
MRHILGWVTGRTEPGETPDFNASSVDWGYLGDLLAHHELLAFAYEAFKEYGLTAPGAMQEKLKNTYYCTLLRNERLMDELVRITRRFREAGIRVAALKGVAFLPDIYTSLPVRSMTDIDILIQDADYQKAAGLLCEMGYYKDFWGLTEEYWRTKQCHVAFYKKDHNRLSGFVELHWALDVKRGGETILPRLWERTREIYANNGPALQTLSPEDALLHIALHQRRFGKMLCLKYAVDLSLLIQKYKDTFDWGYVLEEAKSGKMRTSLYFLLSQAAMFLEVRLPPSVEEGLGVSGRKKRRIHHFIRTSAWLPYEKRDTRKLYLKGHFLLYDHPAEPLTAILNIPREQFAKYYCLTPYARKTGFFYHTRFAYIPFRTLCDLIPKRR